MAQMARAAANDPEFSAFARSVVGSVGGIGSIDSFVRRNYRYRDEVEEVVRTPQFMVHDLERIGYFEGDCDDVSTLLAGMLDALGYRARFVAIRYTPTNPNFEHVFAQAYDGGRWITLDPTVPPGTPVESIEEMIQEA